MRTRLNLIAVLILLIAFPVISNAQQWTDNLPQKNEQYTLHEYQKAFYDFWKPQKVKSGYITTPSGTREKAPGWKQFKRWEWFMTDRVNPTTGEFSSINRIDVYQQGKLLKSAMASQGNWSSLGPNNSAGGYHGLGRINTVGFRTGDANTFYAGSPSGGLWKTTDGGSSWTVQTDNNDVLGVSDIIVRAGSSAATDTIFIGTGDRDGGSSSLNGGQSADNNGIGILKSINGGSSWSTTGLSFPASDGKRVSRMLLDPNDNKTMIVSVLGYFSNQGNVYKSTDRGVTWQTVSNNRFIDMEYKPGSSDILYASTHNGEIWHSANKGEIWTKINLAFGGGGRVELAVTPADPNRVYAIIVNSANRGLSGIFRSNDSGVTWEKKFDGALANHNLLGYPCDASDNKGQGEYDLCIAANPTNADILFIGGVNTWKSTNGGSSWAISTHWSSNCSGGATKVHADKHFLGFQPGTNHLFEGNDGGIYKNETGVSTAWQWIGNGMTIGQIYRLGVSQTSAGTYISGLQDNGSKATSGNIWADNIGGDGMECIVDFSDASVQYASEPSGKIHRTTNGWSSNVNVTDNIPGGEKGEWVTPYIINPNHSDTMFVGYKDLWRTGDYGANWTKVYSGAAGGGNLKSVAMAPSNSKYIFVADSANHLHKTVDGGTNWSLITGSLPIGNSGITYISVSEKSADTVWVSMGNYNGDGVYQTTNGGTTWTNISAGLPNVPIMCVIQNKNNTSKLELYAATDIGVYMKEGNSNWSHFSTGLPNVVVTELEIFYGTGPAVAKLRASTYGRGVWESDLFTSTAAPVAEFKADNLFPSTGKLVTFTDLSANVPTAWEWIITPNTFTFENGTDSSSTNPEVKFTAEGAYTIALSDTNSSGHDVETKIGYIDVSNAPTGYCDAGTKGGYAAISLVRFGTIDNSTAYSSGGYGDYTSEITLVKQGETVELQVETGTQANASDTVDFGVWLDWNRDGNFDDQSEKVVCKTDNTLGNIVTNITVPAWAETGKTRMRIRSKWYNSDCGVSCDTTVNGEVEDYGIIVEKGTPTVAPVANFEADIVTPKLHNAVHFTDLSTNLSQSWSWSITPAHFTFVDGTSATSANPHVAFSTEGIYSVALTVTNSIGSDNEIKTNYITVQPISYCAAGSASGGVGILRVQLNTLDKNTLLTGGPNYYNDYTISDATSLQTGGNYSLILTSYNPQIHNDFLAWIDWNSDGDFEDAGEEVGCGIDINTGTTFSINVPADAFVGATVMRVRAAWGAVCGTTTACGKTTDGEVEDYRINITISTVTWTGTISSDWNDGTNWSGNSVPGASVDVVIPTGVTNSPVISAGTNAECHDITIQTGATLTVIGNLNTTSGN